MQTKLDLEWSPEQIASHLRTHWPDRPERHLCHETIYRALNQGAKSGLSRTLTSKLRIEAQFTALRYFTLDGTDHSTHKAQGSMIRRYIIWRNGHAADKHLRTVINRTSVA